MKQKYIDAYKEYIENTFCTVDDLGKKYNFSPSSFYRALKKENIILPKREYKTTCDIEKLNKAVDLYKAGMSIRKVAKELKITEKAISKYLNYLKIEVRNKVNSNKNIYYCDENYFEVIDTPEKAYWLGFIMADGCIRFSSNNYRMTLELNSIDFSHLEKFQKSIDSNFPIKRRKENMCLIDITRKNFVKHLLELGCVQNKTINGFINIEKIPKILYKDFLRGFLDGDGYIDKTRYRIIYTIKSLSIVNTIKCMLKEFNFSFKTKKEGNYYRLYIENKKEFYECLNFLYKDCSIYLDRKYEIYLKRITS